MVWVQRVGGGIGVEAKVGVNVNRKVGGQVNRKVFLKL